MIFFRDRTALVLALWQDCIAALTHRCTVREYANDNGGELAA